jgi:hypothetical protein
MQVKFSSKENIKTSGFASFVKEVKGKKAKTWIGCLMP